MHILLFVMRSPLSQNLPMDRKNEEGKAAQLKQNFVKIISVQADLVARSMLIFHSMTKVGDMFRMKKMRKETNKDRSKEW